MIHFIFCLWILKKKRGKSEHRKQQDFLFEIRFSKILFCFFIVLFCFFLLFLVLLLSFLSKVPSPPSNITAVGLYLANAHSKKNSRDFVDLQRLFLSLSLSLPLPPSPSLSPRIFLGDTSLFPQIVSVTLDAPSDLKRLRFSNQHVQILVQADVVKIPRISGQLHQQPPK